MILLDLALQGIRDLAGSMRVRLQSGYNALVCPDVAAQTICAGLTELLYSQGYDPDVAALTAAGAKSCGGALTLMTADNATFRLTRNLSAGSGQLFEFNRESRSFVPITESAVEITQFLRGRLGLPTRAVFEEAFLLRGGQLPSQAQLSEIGGGTELAQPRAQKLDPKALAERLEEIEKQIANQREISELEYELDGMQKQRFSLEDRIRELSFDGSELEELDVQAKRIERYESLPDDFSALYDEYVELVERRDADLKRWKTERELLERTERTAPVEPILRDWRLWTGLVVGTFALLAGLALEGALRYIAFLDIPAFGVAALLLYQNLSQREARDRARIRLRLSETRREKIIERDREQIEAVEKMLREADLQGREEIQRALQMRDRIRERRKELQEARHAAAENPELLELREKKQKLEGDIAGLEEKLTNMALSPIDVTALQREADDIRLQLAGTEVEEEKASEPEIDAGEPGGPMGEAWMRSALDLLLTDPYTAAKVLTEQATSLLASLSEGRLSSLSIGANGAVKIGSSQAPEPVPWDQMPASAQDLAYLALRAALVRAVDRRSAMPMVCGEVAGPLAGGLQVTSTLYAAVGQRGQVVNVVRHREEATGAKHIADGAA